MRQVFVVGSPFASMPLPSRKPPSNQPQVTPFAFSKSPTFLLLGSTEADVAPLLQTSPVGSVSLNIVPVDETAGDVVENPCVCPETRLSAPGVDGPYVVEYESSLIANAWA